MEPAHCTGNNCGLLGDLTSYGQGRGFNNPNGLSKLQYKCLQDEALRAGKVWSFPVLCLGNTSIQAEESALLVPSTAVTSAVGDLQNANLPRGTHSLGSCPLLSAVPDDSCSPHALSAASLILPPGSRQFAELEIPNNTPRFTQFWPQNWNSHMAQALLFFWSEGLAPWLLKCTQSFLACI